MSLKTFGDLSMAINTYEVQPLFAEPMFRASIEEAISPKQVEFLKNLKMVQNKSNLISENLYIFDLPELKSIKKAVHEALAVYASEVMGISQKLYVTQSWALISPQNIGMHGHSHSNSIVSGSLYYCDMPTPVAGMVFDKHRTYRQIELDPEQDKNNIYNPPMNVVVPKKNDVLLFSSSLQHFVQVNTATEPRYSIAFNSFVKGTVGSHKDVSALKL